MSAEERSLEKAVMPDGNIDQRPENMVMVVLESAMLLNELIHIGQVHVIPDHG